MFLVKKQFLLLEDEDEDGNFSGDLDVDCRKFFRAVEYPSECRHLASPPQVVPDGRLVVMN
jgi:hypothetical protein